MSDRNISKIDKLIRATLESAGVAKKVDRQQAVAYWKEIVGEKLAEHTEALRVENDLLKVRVTSASWRNELVFLKEEILKKIAEKIGKGKINDIYFC